MTCTFDSRRLPAKWSGKRAVHGIGRIGRWARPRGWNGDGDGSRPVAAVVRGVGDGDGGGDGEGDGEGGVGGIGGGVSQSVRRKM